jgi:hypothetical protein
MQILENETDESFSKADREEAKIPSNEMGLMVYDGDADPVWIESLNLV